jgi:protocatechuate 3,4-dioxygenase beta subunit
MNRDSSFFYSLFFFTFLISFNFIGVQNQDWKLTIADIDEPGERMIITGKVYNSDRQTPAEGITLFIYHTDADGYYSRPGENEKYRLNGTLVTGPEGKYEFTTIKPASYPRSNIPAHVHYVASGEKASEQYFELRFEGDPFISPDEYKEESKRGNFSSVQKLVKDEYGILRGSFDLILK